MINKLKLLLYKYSNAPSTKEMFISEDEIIKLFLSLESDIKRVKEENIALLGVAEMLVKIVEGTEFTLSAQEESYCPFCGALEVYSEPEPEWYEDKEQYLAALNQYEHPHRVDCPRQMALAAYVGLRGTGKE